MIHPEHDNFQSPFLVGFGTRCFDKVPPGVHNLCYFGGTTQCLPLHCRYTVRCCLFSRLALPLGLPMEFFSAVFLLVAWANVHVHVHYPSHLFRDISIKYGKCLMPKYPPKYYFNLYVFR